MAGDNQDVTLLKNYRLTTRPHVNEGWEWQGGGPARAAAAFTGDISHLIPLIADAVDNCAYSPVTNIAAFPYEGLRVVIGDGKMNVYGTDDEAVVKELVNWIIKRLSLSIGEYE